MPGPLQGLKIIELGSIGPGPFCGMMLADAGATVIRIERPGAHVDTRDAMLRSRKIVHLDLKAPGDREHLLELIKDADALFEGMRPGTLERLGLAPEKLLQDNARLVVGRMTGWGQTGPYAKAAGHDLNYAGRRLRRRRNAARLLAHGRDAPRAQHRSRTDHRLRHGGRRRTFDVSFLLLCGDRPMAG